MTHFLVTIQWVSVVNCLSHSCLVMTSRLMESDTMLARLYRASDVRFSSVSTADGRTVTTQGYNIRRLSSTMPWRLFLGCVGRFPMRSLQAFVIGCFELQLLLCFLVCPLKDNIQSRVTPRYTGYSVFSSVLFSQVTLRHSFCRLGVFLGWHLRTVCSRFIEYAVHLGGWFRWHGRILLPLLCKDRLHR